MLRFTKSRYITECVVSNVICIWKNLVTSFNKIFMSALTEDVKEQIFVCIRNGCILIRSDIAHNEIVISIDY